MGPRNHVLDGCQDHPWEEAVLGVVWPIEKHWDSLLQSTGRTWPVIIVHTNNYGPCFQLPASEYSTYLLVRSMVTDRNHKYGPCS